MLSSETAADAAYSDGGGGIDDGGIDDGGIDDGGINGGIDGGIDGGSETAADARWRSDGPSRVHDTSSFCLWSTSLSRSLTHPAQHVHPGPRSRPMGHAINTASISTETSMVVVSGVVYSRSEELPAACAAAIVRSRWLSSTMP